MTTDKIDMDYAREIIVRLRNMGTALSIDGESLGFRGAGSRSAKEASLYVKDEMIRIGLAEVTLDKIPVDAWEFRGAWVEFRADVSKAQLSAASEEGIPPSECSGPATVPSGDAPNTGDADMSNVVLADSKLWALASLMCAVMLALAALAVGVRRTREQ